jgi:hypothetical protein
VFGFPSYLCHIVPVHRHYAKPENRLLPRNALGQLQQRHRESRLRQTLAQQGEAGAGVDEDVHSGIPHGAHVACCEFYGDYDVVDCKN